MISGRRKYDHISCGLNELGWLSAHQFVTYFDICLIHDIITTGRPHMLRSPLVFNRERTTYDTRQSARLSLRRVKINYGKRQFMYRAVHKYKKFNIWRGIPSTNRRTVRKNARISIQAVAGWYACCDLAGLWVWNVCALGPVCECSFYPISYLGSMCLDWKAIIWVDVVVS